MYKYLSIVLLFSFLPVFGQVSVPALGQENEDKRVEFGFDYTTEVQSNLKSINWANELYLNLNARISDKLFFNFQSLSLAKTRKDAIIDDLQVFSNLNSDNLLFALATTALEWRISEKSTLYAGVLNMNNDYFASDVTSLFTNSSCGIFPTLSCSFTSADFPYASVGVNYSYDTERIRILASLFNGQGFNRFDGRSNCFRFCPKSDGIYALSQIEVKNDASSYFVGMGLHNGSPIEGLENKTRTVFWTYGEQALSPFVSIIMDYSHAFDKDLACTEFVGLGTKINLKRTEVGLFTDYAKFDEGEEFATELTSKVSLNDHFFIQPSLHFVHNNSSDLVGLVRFGIEF